MSRQPAMLALTVPSTTRQSHDLISPEKTMPRPTTSLRIAVCAASAALAADWFGVIGAMAPRGLNVLVIMPVPSSGRYGKEWATLLRSRAIFCNGAILTGQRRDEVRLVQARL